MRILILDDSIDRHKAFALKFSESSITHVFNTREAIRSLAHGAVYDAVFLDHDLGPEKTFEPSGSENGYGVAQWLATHPDRCPQIIILHTMNPVGAGNMKALLPQAKRAPGFWLA